MAALLVAWLGAFAGFLSAPAAVLFLAATGSTILRRAWRPLAVLLVANPLTLAGALAAERYVRGTGELVIQGEPYAKQYNIDSKTRYQTRATGCVIQGDEWVWEGTNNRVLLALGSIFGPMPGTYDGPYPTQAEVRGALGSASPLSAQELKTGSISVAGRSVPLRRGLGETFAVSIEANPDHDRRDPLVALWRNRVVIAAFFHGLPDKSRREPFVVLIDAATGKPFAYLGEMPHWSVQLPKQWS